MLPLLTDRVALIKLFVRNDPSVLPLSTIRVRISTQFWIFSNH
jgi:hypothetical protein